MKRFVAVLLLVVMFSAMIGMLTCAFAAEARASELISTTSVAIYSQPGGIIKVNATISATGIVDKVGITSIKVQKYSGGAWSTIKSVYNKFGYDRISYGYSLTTAGTIGTKYRAVVSYKVEHNGASDTRTRTSSSVTAAN